MNETWSNNRFMLNGRVKPPIVLRSDKEILIAQNAHNLIWEKYRSEYDAIHKILKALKESETDQNEIEKQWHVLHVKAGREIDELIIIEISNYRKFHASHPYFDVEERMEQIEKQVEELEIEIDDVRSMAEEVLDSINENTAE
ncbi:MAG: DUF3375 domain-containing protein [Oscillospiraceae bacterium]|nr:DUF3375 domain-containing protein [Oscillospiraceae bacterium]